MFWIRYGSRKGSLFIISSNVKHLYDSRQHHHHLIATTLQFSCTTMMNRIHSFIITYYVALHFHNVKCFQSPLNTRNNNNYLIKPRHDVKHNDKHSNFNMINRSVSVILQATSSKNNNNEMSIDELKLELTQYLKKRDEVNANESAKSEVGKVIGGTKGNAILEYVSGAPNKEYVIDEAPDIFDYTELAKYGFSYLATPIMNAGGRREMYSLMGLPEPSISDKIRKPKVVPKLVIDRTGETDEARYSGLKVTQIVDDDEMGRKLAEFQDKKKKGENMKQKLIEEEYVMPFADKRNIGPRQTPDWTPEMLDEQGKKAGQAMAWAKKARDGEFQIDPYELLSIEGSLQLYSIITTLLVAFAFGSSSSMLLEDVVHYSNPNALLELMRAPALAFVLTSLGSSIVCGVVMAPQKNRNSFVWGVKGFAGGPLAIQQLRGLDSLITRGEAEENMKNV